MEIKTANGLWVMIDVASSIVGEEHTDVVLQGIFFLL